MPFPKAFFGIGIATICILVGPTLLLNILKDPPAVEEARRARFAKQEALIQAQRQRKIEAFAEKVVDEQEKSTPIYGRPQGHLEEVIGSTEKATAWEKLREENRRR